jgi:hypothetical protein
VKTNQSRWRVPIFLLSASLVLISGVATATQQHGNMNASSALAAVSQGVAPGTIVITSAKHVFIKDQGLDLSYSEDAGQDRHAGAWVPRVIPAIATVTPQTVAHYTSALYQPHWVTSGVIPWNTGPMAPQTSYTLIDRGHNALALMTDATSGVIPWNTGPNISAMMISEIAAEDIHTGAIGGVIPLDTGPNYEQHMMSAATVPMSAHTIDGLITEAINA